VVFIREIGDEASRQVAARRKLSPRARWWCAEGNHALRGYGQNSYRQWRVHQPGRCSVRADGCLPLEDPGLNEAARRAGEPRLAGESSLDTALEGLFGRYGGKVFSVTERLLVAKALELTHHNQVQAARFLGVSRNVLRVRMQRYGL
jgi:Bacterial regulatory protein, Fis family